MDRQKQKSLEAAGFWVGDVEDFLDLTAEERQLVALRVGVSRAVRCLRQERHLTQQQLAAKLKTSQSRVAKIEAGAGDVSLDLLFRSLFAVGGDLGDVAGGDVHTGKRLRNGRTRRQASAAGQNSSKPVSVKGR
jgi:DNA-binding XRE family transcriptional regulator